ncbi:hypothetical protein J6590_081715 [Homalodisca vitripennis]|nr:hypothetical protein J6590_081715 [Homalodisca vitripennis]
MTVWCSWQVETVEKCIAISVQDKNKQNQERLKGLGKSLEGHQYKKVLKTLQTQPRSASLLRKRMVVVAVNWLIGGDRGIRPEGPVLSAKRREEEAVTVVLGTGTSPPSVRGQCRERPRRSNSEASLEEFRIFCVVVKGGYCLLLVVDDS